MAATELMDPTAAKIILAVQSGDSINRISEKIGASYSWVYDWVERLEDEGVISNDDDGIRVVDHEISRRYDEMMGALYSWDDVTQEDAYVIPHFARMAFAYTAIDAAYVWTHGGYQIARSHDDYPVFIQVYERDVDNWVAFFERYGIDSAVGERSDASDVESDVYYVLFPQTDGIDAEWVDGNPVVPLEDAIEQMTENRPAYEPALEMIADEYDVNIDASHHDAVAGD